MDTNFEKTKKQIVESLEKKLSTLECTFCKQKNFTLAGGYFAHDLQEDLQNRVIGGVNIPTVPLICTNCGFVAEFAAGTLGLLPKPTDDAGKQIEKETSEQGNNKSSEPKND